MSSEQDSRSVCSSSSPPSQSYLPLEACGSYFRQVRSGPHVIGSDVRSSRYRPLVPELRLNEYDADDIAKVIERRLRPSYEEWMAVFSPMGRPEPSRAPFRRSRDAAPPDAVLHRVWERGLFARRGKAPALARTQSVSGRDPSGPLEFGRVVGAGSRPRFYTGGQKMNQAVSVAETRAAVKLPLTVLFATPLTVCEAPVVATAASVATITKAIASSRKIMSIMAIP